MYIKGFTKDLTFKGVQFEIGKEYKIENGEKPLELCTNTVFHFCDSLEKVHEFYDVRLPYHIFFEIEVLGKIIQDDEKMGSNHIKILREIKGVELIKLKKQYKNNNTGIFNRGIDNVGTFNIGDRNTGHRNKGNSNTGNKNNGHQNVGSYNIGRENTGDRNTGENNVGSNNTGSNNTGWHNIGNENTGNKNIGNNNAGWDNIGNKNTGSNNIGNNNTGTGNKGNGNSGNFNITNHTAGIFNTQPTYRAFDKELTKEQFIEILESKGYEVFNRFCMKKDYKDSWELFYDFLPNEDIEHIRNIPYVDLEILKKITGIDFSKDKDI
ncbi:MAG: pentapeptide repeat-containing protein [Cetobacterium sp.]